MNMNYFSFYNKGKELLIDSLASLWFKGASPRTRIYQADSDRGRAAFC